MATEIVVPELGESVIEATVGHWLKKEGESVGVGEVLVELETDKVNVEVGATRAGKLARIEHQEGDDVHVGDVLGMIEEVPEGQGGSNGQTASTSEPAPVKEADHPEGVVETSEAVPAPEGQKKVEPQESPAAGEARVTPVAQRVAQDLHVDLTNIQGTGPGGRVTREDVEKLSHQEAPVQASPAPRPTEKVRVAPTTSPLPSADRREERVKMSRRRRTIAQRLVEVQQSAAILTTFNEIDMTAVMDLRKRRNEDFQARYGIKLGITSFFVKAAIRGLKDFPRLNAEVQGDEMVLKHHYDIGVAVGASEGLVVPVLHHADTLSFAEIEHKIKEFASQADQGTLSLEDLRGGTFSITNGGVFGSLMSTPILNPPEVGILGLHKIEPRPVVVQNEIAIRPMMYVALSYDHRIVDGREAVQFLVRVKALLEDPEALLIEG